MFRYGSGQGVLDEQGELYRGRITGRVEARTSTPALRLVRDSKTSRVTGATVNLSRNADGTWDCNVTPAPNGWKAAYLPGGCQ